MILIPFYDSHGSLEKNNTLKNICNIINITLPSKIEWDLTNGPLRRLPGGPFSGSCSRFFGKLQHLERMVEVLSKGIVEVQSGNHHLGWCKMPLNEKGLLRAQMTRLLAQYLLLASFGSLKKTLVEDDNSHIRSYPSLPYTSWGLVF